MAEMEIQTDDIVILNVEGTSSLSSPEDTSASPSRSPSPLDETLAPSSSSSSLTVIPGTPKPHPKLLEDQPPAYGDITTSDQQQDRERRIAAEILQEWHQGEKIPFLPVEGGISYELRSCLSRDYLNYSAQRALQAYKLSQFNRISKWVAHHSIVGGTNINFLNSAIVLHHPTGPQTPPPNLLPLRTEYILNRRILPVLRAEFEPAQVVRYQMSTTFPPCELGPNLQREDGTHRFLHPGHSTNTIPRS